MTEQMTFGTAGRDESGRWVTSCSLHARQRSWTVRMVWESADGRWDPVAVEIRRTDGSTIRARELRELPHAFLVKSHRAHLSASLERFASLHVLGPGEWAFGEPTDFPADRALLRDAAASIRRPQRRQGKPRITVKDLDQVAAAYKRAKASGSPVTAEVMTECGLSKSTAGKWIMRARDAGLLKGYEVRR